MHGHGRLIDPPSRSSMWRYGFNNPPNYDDNQLYCGGRQVCHVIQEIIVFINVLKQLFNFQMEVYLCIIKGTRMTGKGC